MKAGSVSRTVQVIRRHHQLQTELKWNLHVWHVLHVLMLFIVIEILADFLQDDATIRSFISSDHREHEILNRKVLGDELVRREN